MATCNEPIRCWPTNDPAYIVYHDEEWGRPVRDERGLYERTKRDLAAREWRFVQHYADAKSEVVEGILARAAIVPATAGERP